MIAFLIGSGILGVLGTIVVALLQYGKRSPASRTAESEGWARLNGSALDRLTQLETKVERLEVTETKFMVVMQLWVPQLIAWGRGGGAGEPPSPPPGVVYPPDPNSP